MNSILHIFMMLKSRKGASAAEFAVIAFAAVLILIGLSAFTSLGFIIANKIRDLIVGT